MFKKYVNPSTDDNSTNDMQTIDEHILPDHFDSNEGFNPFEDEDISDVELTGPLSDNTDKSWNDIMDKYNELGTESEPEYIQNYSGETLLERVSHDDSTSEYTSGESSYDNNDLRLSNSQKKQKQPNDSQTSINPKRLLIALIAIMFGLVILIFVKITNYTNTDYSAEKSGIVDSDDSIQTDEADDTISEDTVSSVESEEQATYKELKKGVRNKDVLKLQQRLYDLGFLNKESCTGYFGDYTEKIVKKFQKKVGLPQTGIADSATQEKLFSADAPKNN